MTTQAQPKEITLAERAQAIKAKYKVQHIARIATKDREGKDVEAWIREPGFNEMGAYASVVSQDPIRAMKIILNGIWLEGDECIREEVPCFMSILPRLEKIVEVQQSSLEKF